jgi:hypothetical protein
MKTLNKFITVLGLRSKTNFKTKKTSSKNKKFLLKESDSLLFLINNGNGNDFLFI